MKWLKIGGVVFGALVITALGIDASDTLSGKGGTLLGQVVSVGGGVCPVGMVEVSSALSFTCVDKWEVSASEDCSYKNPANQTDTLENINNPECSSDSIENAMPWRYITRDQAEIACARAGKRLPSAEEWYKAALGTVDDKTSCNIDGNSPEETGSNQSCVSAAGAEDMIGNVWEWVKDDVIEGSYNGRSLPEEGYVSQVDSGGVPTMSETRANNLFNDDYVWSAKTGAYGVMRGGFYGSESDAGIYSFHAKTVPTMTGTAIGFRCVK